MGDNGEVGAKECPFLDKPCIADRCGVFTEMTKVGVAQRFGMCAFSAMAMMLSEINQKTKDNMQVPRLFRG